MYRLSRLQGCRGYRLVVPVDSEHYNTMLVDSSGTIAYHYSIRSQFLATNADVFKKIMDGSEAADSLLSGEAR